MLAPSMYSKGVARILGWGILLRAFEVELTALEALALQYTVIHHAVMGAGRTTPLARGSVNNPGKWSKLQKQILHFDVVLAGNAWSCNCGKRCRPL
jgi:hypothetical protein